MHNENANYIPLIEGFTTELKDYSTIDSLFLQFNNSTLWRDSVLMSHKKYMKIEES